MQSHSVDASPMKEEDLSHDKDVSVKEKEESSLSGASPKADEVNELHTGNLSPKVKEEMNEPSGSSSPSDLENTAEKTSGVSSSVEEENNVQIIEDPDDLLHRNGCNQLVVYDPQANGAFQNEPVPGDKAVYQTPPFNNAPRPPPRVLPSVGAFTVQCANCFKWRLIPTKEKYEEIRESILQFPFVCEIAREWRPSISCDDPADISQDGSRLWAIDKPNIALPPPGWERLLRIRGEGSTKFADVYYQAPSGKKLRSMVDVQKFLLEHPEYITAGVTMSQFSFQIPRPLQENYVRKKRPLD
ncbi:hypothetical protein Syun_024747 [Stephania yunnanensis]|uniref:Uncharacterized protein n=1 Tax=Stephania yunnanensis TaxID=152371 RepID=A0AAP0ETB9_9MAGN